MLVIYNPDYLFQDVKDKHKIKLYKQRIAELASELEKKSSMTQDIIKRFGVKKMKGTNSIFKFELNRQEASRCLFKYQKSQDEIFINSQEIILIRAVTHDKQGLLGRRLDKEYHSFEQFLFGDDDAVGSYELEQSINDSLGKNFMKIVNYDNNFIDEFIEEFNQVNNEAIYKLSINQQKSLKESGPLFIRGSAGSGKTLVLVSIAAKNAHKDTDQIYFTFTPLLKNTAEKIYNKYKNMKGIIGQTSFFEIKDFYLKELNLVEGNYFSFIRFNNWYKRENFRGRYKDLRNIEVINLWTEIRGLIKGYIGNDFYRILTIKNINKYLKDYEIKELVSKRYIKKDKNSNSIYYITNSEELYKRINGTPLHYHLINQDQEEALLDDYSYLNEIKESYSLFNKKERKVVLKFVKDHYQKYLIDNKYYDDNDLARKIIIDVSKNNIKKYDFVFIDELQDLTEMQIIALSRLSKSPNNIVMAGDNSQVINPTFFARGRTGLIFRNIFKTTLNTTVELNENYRNSENIILVVNKLLDVREEKLGTYSEDIREVSVELDKKEGLPIFINLSKNEINNEISKWIGIPKVAIIVATEETKEELLKVNKIEGETNIFTVHDIKGLEFSKILTYNIVSEHQEAWEEIMSGEVEKGGDLVSQYKYFFNLLYVAITRGRENLFFYEDNKNTNIINEIRPLFLTINNKNVDVLDISDLDTIEDRKRQADDYFQEQDYNRAKTFYMRANDKVMSEISDCFNKLEIGETKLGAFVLLKYPDRFNEVVSYLRSDVDLLLYLIYNFKSNSKTIDELNETLGNLRLRTLLKDFKNIDDEAYSVLLKYTLELLSALKSRKISNLINGGQHE